MADVFISYHMNSAGEVVCEICDTLERDGISCWYADRDMSLGAFAGTATQEIEACKIFLLILNKESSHSAHVAAETALAFDRYAHDSRQIELIPFLIDQTDLRKEKDRISKSIRYYTILFPSVDGVPPDDAHIQALKGKIQKSLPTFDLK